MYSVELIILHDVLFVIAQLPPVNHQSMQGEMKAVDVLNGCWFSTLLFLPPCQLPVIHVACQPTNAHTNSTPDSKAAGEIYL